MKPNRRRPLKPAALLLLLLGLSLGGFGLLSMVFPGLVPDWMSGLWGQGSQTPEDRYYESAKPYRSNEKTDGTSGSDKDSPGTAGLSGTGRYYDPKALPKGLTSIDGEGGTGMNRAVKKNGVWFPVYSPGPNPGSGPPPLTVIPLSIASGNPTPGRVNQTFFYQAEAIGGTPPYAWSAFMNGSPSVLALGASDGLLTGTSKDPLRLKVDLTVTDAAGTTDSAKLDIVIKPELDLKIDTESIPIMTTTGGGWDFGFAASGGVPPYFWKEPQPVGRLHLYSGTGGVEVVSASPGEHQIIVNVVDAQGTQVEKPFMLKVADGLEITTDANLPPVVEGRSYQGSFAAAGGTPPYRWDLLGNPNFPDKSWRLSREGVLSGFGTGLQQVIEFTVLVEDAEDGSYEKKFRLVGGDFLTAVPSREKVGLAWVPRDVAALLSGKGLGVGGFRVLRDGAPVYEGTGSNFVDHGVATGSTPRYTLVALISDGSAQPVAEKEVAVLPQTLTRAEPGRTGDPYADRLVSFRPLTAGGYGASGMPRNVTGPPDGRSTYSPAYKPGEVASLHAQAGAGGSIELEFTDNIVEIAPGEELTVFENVLFVGGNGNQRFMEPAVISVALFPGEWHRLTCDVVPPAAGQPLDLKDPFYYARGIAGRNGTTGSDPTNPNASGGDSLDLDDVAARAGLSWIRYIRIQSTGDAALRDDAGGDLIRHPDDPAFNPLSGSGSSGFDLDAVSAVHY
jgi:hypothetical protein